MQERKVEVLVLGMQKQSRPTSWDVLAKFVRMDAWYPEWIEVDIEGGVLQSRRVRKGADCCSPITLAQRQYY